LTIGQLFDMDFASFHVCDCIQFLNYIIIKIKIDNIGSVKDAKLIS